MVNKRTATLENKVKCLIQTAVLLIPFFVFLSFSFFLFFFHSTTCHTVTYINPSSQFTKHKTHSGLYTFHHRRPMKSARQSARCNHHHHPPTFIQRCPSSYLLQLFFSFTCAWSTSIPSPHLSINNHPDLFDPFNIFLFILLLYIFISFCFVNFGRIWDLLCNLLGCYWHCQYGATQSEHGD